MDKKSVYIETTIVSYLTARPSRDLLAAAWQKSTADWWRIRRERFDLFTSDAVWREATKGDPEAAKRREQALAGLPRLSLTGDVVDLAEDLIQAGALPPDSIVDALHIAFAAVHGVDYLLTWNFRHIDNAETKPMIRAVCAIRGFGCPEICTPQELMGADDDGG